MQLVTPLSAGYYRLLRGAARRRGVLSTHRRRKILADRFDLSELIGEFQDEARRELDSLDAALLHLEEHGELPAERRGALVRELHTLKGNAGMLGLRPLVDAVHAVEAVFRADRQDWPQPLLDALFEAAAALRRAVDRAGSDEQDQALARLSAIRLDQPGAESPARAARGEPEPPLSAASPRADGPETTDAGGASDAEAVDSAALETGDRLRVPLVKLDRLLADVGDLVRLRHAFSELLEHSADSLEAVGLRRPLGDLHEELARTTANLHSATLELRLIPAARLLNRFPSLARDLARAQGKSVRVEVEGGGVELDKATLDALAEPLLHLVRNAVDHGLGTPAEREADGKPPAGELRIRARAAGDQLEVEVADDGAGLDRDRIVETARRRGIVGSNERVDPDDVAELIFRPGFTTREAATTVSGRGVGLDVVRQSVRRLRGSLTVHSDPGAGTTFVLRLPLTLAIVPSILFESHGQPLALAATDVEETVRRVVPEGAAGTEVVRHRDEVFPVVLPERLFGWSEASAAALGTVPPRERPTALIVRREGRAAAVLTDRVREKRDLVIKPLPHYLGRQPALSGAAVLPDRRVALLLDPSGLLALSLVSHQRTEGAGAAD